MYSGMGLSIKEIRNSNKTFLHLFFPLRSLRGKQYVYPRIFKSLALVRTPNTCLSYPKPMNYSCKNGAYGKSR